MARDPRGRNADVTGLSSPEKVTAVMFTSMELILLLQHTAAEEQLIFNSAHPLCLPTSDYSELSGWTFLHPCVCFTVNPYPDDVNLLDDKMMTSNDLHRGWEIAGPGCPFWHAGKCWCTKIGDQYLLKTIIDQLWLSEKNFQKIQ